MNVVKFRYINKPENPRSHTGVMTIATKYVSDTQLKIGIACCHKIEEFSKQKGRQIALNRLEHPDNNNVYTLDKSDKIFGQIIKFIYAFDDTHFNLPFWAKRKLKKMYLEFNGDE